jgi:hypothetical protein
MLYGDSIRKVTSSYQKQVNCRKHSPSKKIKFYLLLERHDGKQF